MALRFDAKYEDTLAINFSFFEYGQTNFLRIAKAETLGFGVLISCLYKNFEPEVKVILGDREELEWDLWANQICTRILPARPKPLLISIGLPLLLCLKDPQRKLMKFVLDQIESNLLPRLHPLRQAVDPIAEVGGVTVEDQTKRVAM